jgi:heat shock protein HslJ
MRLLALISIVSLAACSSIRTEAPEFRSSVAGDWQLVELSGAAPPPGSGARPATVIFAADTNHADGFAGCNRFSGAYETSGSSLRFRPLVMTRMFCQDGMELETGLAGAFEAVRQWRLSGDTLTFRDAQRVVARFLRAMP